MTSFNNLVNQATGALGSLIGKPNELARQRQADDGRYYKDILCFFELVSDSQSWLYPLVCGVQAFTLTEPFAVDIVPTDYAGLGVHRQGIVQRRLQISGHTCFAPRPLPVAVPLLRRKSNLPKNYSPKNLSRPVTTPLSGQRLFEYLQQEVFRAYSDLCRDPATAQGVKLLFHNPRDQEHWQVEPMSFTLQRGPQSNFTYPFAIELTVVGPALPTALPMVSADRGVLDRIRDTVTSVTEALDGLRGAIQDLSSVQGSFKVLGKQVAGIIDSASYVVQAASSFVVGTQALINVPRAAIFALFNACTDVCELFASLVDVGTSLADWPPSIVGAFRNMQNNCDALLVQTGAFKPPLPVQLKLLNDDNGGLVTADNVQRVASFSDLTAAGTAPTAGQVTAAQSAQAPVINPVTYQSVREVTVRQGDTLHRIAARELGRTSAWRDIAILNDIKPPYGSAVDRRAAGPGQLDGFSGALTYGQTILVPSTSPPPEQVGNDAVLGVAPEAGQAEQTFGRDLQLRRVDSGNGDPRYDLDLGSHTGLPDLATHAGIDQLSQAVEQRVVQAQGSSAMFPDFGLAALVGTGYASIDETLRDFRIAQALQADPRVASLDQLQVSLGRPGQVADALYIDATVTAVGNSAQAQVGVAI